MKRISIFIKLSLLILMFGACKSSSVFKLVLLPDTQTYTKQYPEIFRSQTEWIAKNAKKYTFVLQQGDITDYNSEEQWKIAADAMSLMDGKIPYAFVPGNHDMGSKPRFSADVRNTDLLNKYFSYEKYSKMPGFGGAFEEGKMDNTWHTFKKGGYDWLIMCLEFGPRNRVLDWAAKVIEEHPSHKVIINTHAYMFADDRRMTEGHRWRPQQYGIGKSTGSEAVNDGEQIWEKLARRYPNVMFVFSGHVLFDGTGTLVSTGDNGNKVYQMLANYQEGVINTVKGGNGFLRIITINTRKGKVDVKTYSPYVNEYKTDSSQQFGFTGVDFRTPAINTTPVPAAIESAVHDFMKKYDVKGLSLAISKDGKMLYDKAYGYADTAGKEKASTSSLYRIASISKPLTALAVLKLAEQGKLNLDAKVFGNGAVLGTTYGRQPYGSEIENITVRQLLQHTSGGWANNSKDPMFTNPALDANELISWTLDNHPLDTLPGTRYAYSNFGYCVLGRIIEKLTGRKYEEYVRKEVLLPMGIADMVVGGNTLAQRKPNEVIYYGNRNDDPYKYNVTRMDSHGGWIASASDLVKMMLHMDGFTTVPDYLSQASMKEMTTPALANSNYGCGIRKMKDNSLTHNGSLPGTGTEFIGFANGTCCAIVTNSNPRGDYFKDLDLLIKDISKKAVTE